MIVKTTTPTFFPQALLALVCALFLTFPLVAQHEGHNHDGHSHNHGHNHHTHSHDGQVTDAHDEPMHTDHDGEEFNASEMIMHHIADANEFHVGGHFSIPLPVMVYNLDKGTFDAFMSSRFEHGHKTYNGYELLHDRVHAVDGSRIIDFSITKNVFTMLLAALILLVVFFSIASAYKKRGVAAPKGLQSLMEPVMNFVINDLARDNIGPKYRKYVPFLATLFFFILVLNLLGLVPFFPGSGNVSGNIAVTLALAFFAFLVVNFSGNKNYWGHIFAPPAPKPLWLILVPLEFLAIFIKPITLAIRLFANITAGHIIILSLVSLIFIFGGVGESVAGAAGGATVAVPFVLFMNCIELLVAFLQAYIFTMLTALYIGLAVEEAHH